jgi:hypothetical protein
VFGPLTQPPPLLRISFTAGLDFLAACLLVSVRRRSSAPLKLMPRCCILLVARVSQSPLATGLWSDPFPSPVAGPGFQSHLFLSVEWSTTLGVVDQIPLGPCLIQLRPEFFSLCLS